MTTSTLLILRAVFLEAGYSDTTQAVMLIDVAIKQNLITNSTVAEVALAKLLAAVETNFVIQKDIDQARKALGQKVQPTPRAFKPTNDRDNASCFGSDDEAFGYGIAQGLSGLFPAWHVTNAGVGPIIELVPTEVWLQRTS